MPAAAQRVWDWFWLLDRTRNGNGYAANRITYPDIRALAGDRPDDWEIAAILAMDQARLAKTHGAGDQVEDEVSERSMTPELFDALWGA